MGRPKMNYRVVRDGDTLSIREVFYDERDEPVAIADVGATPLGESVTELVLDIDKMLKACALPTIKLPLTAKEP